MKVLALKRTPERHPLAGYSRFTYRLSRMACNSTFIFYFSDHMYSIEQRHIMLSKSDFVVCTLPGTASTKDFMGKHEFEAMPETSVFISLGRYISATDSIEIRSLSLHLCLIRGVAVDEDALIKASSNLSENEQEGIKFRIRPSTVDRLQEQHLMCSGSRKYSIPPKIPTNLPIGRSPFLLQVCCGIAKIYFLLLIMLTMLKIISNLPGRLRNKILC